MIQSLTKGTNSEHAHAPTVFCFAKSTSLPEGGLRGSQRMIQSLTKGTNSEHAHN